MDSGGGNKDGDSDTSGLSSLHDHSDLLIPNPSFVSSPGSVSSTASSSMMMTSPASEEHDLFKQMDCQMTSPGDLQQSDGYHVSIPSQPHHQPDSSPPNVVVDDSPLQPCMDRNKQCKEIIKNVNLQHRFDWSLNCPVFFYWNIRSVESKTLNEAPNESTRGPRNFTP